MSSFVFFFYPFQTLLHPQILTDMILSPKMQSELVFYKDYVVDVYFFTACIKLHHLHQLEKKKILHGILHLAKGELESQLFQQKVKPGYSQAKN